MTIDTFYSESADGFIESSHSTTYSTARSGGGSKVAPTTEVYLQVGQNYIGGFGYYLYETFLSFDTSTIPDSAIISSVTLSLHGGDYVDQSTTDFTIEARTYDWGASLTTADWVAGADLTSNTLLASRSTSGWSTSAYNDLTENGSNFVSAINKTGITRIILCSSRTKDGNTPTGAEYVNLGASEKSGTSNDPKLSVTYVLGPSLSGSITMSGAVYRQVNKSLSGTTGNLTGALTVGAAYFKELAGSVGNLTGSLVRATNKALSGTFTGIGSLTKFITKSFSGTTGTLEATMNATKTKLVSLTGTMGTLSGVVTSVQTGFGVALSGSISSISGSIGRTTNKALSGAITPTGRVTLLGTFRSAIMKAGTIIRRTIQGGSG